MLRFQVRKCEPSQHFLRLRRARPVSSQLLPALWVCLAAFTHLYVNRRCPCFISPTRSHEYSHLDSFFILRGSKSMHTFRRAVTRSQNRLLMRSLTVASKFWLLSILGVSYGRAHIAISFSSDASHRPCVKWCNSVNLVPHVLVYSD